jgi:hypothetical protein
MRLEMLYSPIESKETLESIFLAFAKEYRRLAKKNAIPLEITVIGGASILLNYSFRESTYDVDVIMLDDPVLKKAINNVAIQFNLEPKWLNTDFEKSSSYSRKLLEHAEFYKDFLGLIDVRTIKDEYLIAMKLKASREYKYDISDVIGILGGCQKQGKTMTRALIEKAVIDLYGSLNEVKQEAWDRLDSIMKNGDYDVLILEFRKLEKERKAKEEEKLRIAKQTSQNNKS